MHPMPHPQDPAVLLETHLPFIDRVAGKLTRQHGATPDDTDDFASWAKLRLLEDDCAILRKFRGESQLTTYLTVVMTMLYRDWRVSRFGRWRPSAAARRQGAVAVQLETLVYRDGMGYDQAVQTLRSRGGTDLSNAALTRLWGGLPPRGPTRPRQAGGEALLERAPARGSADAELMRAEADDERASLFAALRAAIDALEDEDRTILKLRFWERLSVADTARALGLEQKPLYRRMDRLLAGLRRALEAQGVSPERIRGLTMDEEGE